MKNVIRVDEDQVRSHVDEVVRRRETRERNQTKATGKQGAIPSHLAPILDRLGINPFKWLEMVSQFDHLFSHVVGTAAQLAERAAEVGRRWYHGRALCAEAFG